MPRCAIILSTIFLAGATARAQEAKFQKTTHIYKTVDDVRIEADVHRANDDAVRPVVVWIHGGSLVNGTRTDAPRNLLDLCRDEGYALVSLDYRLAPEVKLPAIAADIDDAFAWLREQGPEKLHVDTDRCVVAGGSAGGYLALLAGTRLKPRPRAILAYYPFTDIREIDSPAFVEAQRRDFGLVSKEDAYRGMGTRVLTSTMWNTEPNKSRGRYVTYVLQNGLWTKDIAGFELTDRKQREAYSPVRSAKRDFPQTLLIHGTADRIVHHTESEAMAAQLARFKVPHELISIPRADHGFTGGDKQAIDDAQARAAAFIRQRLKDSAKTKSTRGKRPAG